MSVDRARGRYHCEALSTDLPTEVFVGYARAIGSGVVGEVALTGKAVLLDDVAAHPDYVETQGGTRSELCVPVLHRGETVAILNLESQKAGAFRGQLPLMETVAEQVAGAIASARLHAELTRRAGLLEMLGELGRVATDAGELGLLLDRVVGFVHERFPLLLAAILLVDADAEEFGQTAFAGELVPAARRGRRWCACGNSRPATPRRIGQRAPRITSIWMRPACADCVNSPFSMSTMMMETSASGKREWM